MWWHPRRRQFRSVMTFGTAGKAFPASVFKRAQTHLFELYGSIPVAVQRSFADLDHDMSGGSDYLFVLDGLITKTAAEVWATDRILSSKLAVLTTMHHARALYETHALANWVLRDVRPRSLRVLKSLLVERERFENTAARSIGKLPSDIASGGRKLLEDDTVKRLPSVHDMIGDHQDLAFDEAIFWKYASAHIHPGYIGNAAVDARSERVMMEQIIGAVVRHAAGVYNCFVRTYELELGDSSGALSEATRYATY